MEDENQHLDSDSSSSSDDDNSSAEAKQPVYYSDYEDYKNAEWSNYDYCSESSEDESSSQAATSKSNKAEESKKSLPRLFGYSPSLFCRFGGKVKCVPETPEESCKWKTDGKCQSCYGPADPYFEKCDSRCFENRADVPHNRLGPFIFCSFRQRNREPR